MPGLKKIKEKIAEKFNLEAGRGVGVSRERLHGAVHLVQEALTRRRDERRDADLLVLLVRRADEHFPHVTPHPTRQPRRVRNI